MHASSILMIDRRSLSGRYASDEEGSVMRWILSDPPPENKIASDPRFFVPPIRCVVVVVGAGLEMVLCL